MIFSLTDIIPIIPEIFILCMTCVILLLGLYFPQRHITYGLTQLTLIGAAYLTYRLYGETTIYTFNNMFVLDKTASLCKLFVYLMSMFAFLYSHIYNQQRAIAENEYHTLGLFSILGMLVMISAHHFLILFLGIELLSLPLYAMSAMWRTSGIASEAAMKYFVMGALSSGMMLYGFSMLYGATGSLYFTPISALIMQQQGLILAIGLVFVIAGLAFKLGAAPFHLWAPDVYEGAPTSTVLFISAAPKIAVFAIMYHLFVTIFASLNLQWQQMMTIVAILSMSLGNIVAIAQANLKRMLAYSAIAHMGYMSLGFIAGTPEGYSASLFYIVVYALMSMGALGVLIIMSKEGFEVEKFEDLRGLNTRNPWLAFMMLIVMFSMAGIPPTVGFFAKLGVLEALINQDIIWLAALALMFSIIGAYYYLRVIKMMYFDEPVTNQQILITKDLHVAMSLNGILVLGLGIFPSGLIEACRYVFM